MHRRGERISTTARTRSTAWWSAGASCARLPTAKAGASVRRRAHRRAGCVARAGNARKAERLGFATGLHDPDLAGLVAARRAENGLRDLGRLEQREAGVDEARAALPEQRRV